MSLCGCQFVVRSYPGFRHPATSQGEIGDSCSVTAHRSAPSWLAAVRGDYCSRVIGGMLTQAPIGVIDG